jgi:hypothetical protein
MFIIVVGCGRVGAELAYRLFKTGHQISVVDIAASAFNNLPADFRGRLVEGEALNQEILHRAGIEQADGLAVVTNSDSLNAVVAHIARSIYHIPNLAVRNYDPTNRALFEAFNQQVVTSSSWGAQRLEELLYAGNVRDPHSRKLGRSACAGFAPSRVFCGSPDPRRKGASATSRNPVEIRGRAPGERDVQRDRRATASPDQPHGGIR